MVGGASPTHVSFDRVRATHAGATVLDDVTLDIPRHAIFGIIGPSGSGKTTLLRCINRTIDFDPEARVTGEVRVDGVDVRSIADVCELRRRVGMVSPLPVALPLSVRDNVAYAPRLSATAHSRAQLDEIVERCLRQAALWDEVKDRLHDLGTRLSGGQQQRLALARALSHDPEVLCLDSFSIAIDPVTTMKIEDVLLGLQRRLTIVLVTDLVQQARRLASRVAFLNGGRLVECGPAEVVFSARPASALTFDYVRGQFG